MLKIAPIMALMLLVFASVAPFANAVTTQLLYDGFEVDDAFDKWSAHINVERTDADSHWGKWSVEEDGDPAVIGLSLSAGVTNIIFSSYVIGNCTTRMTAGGIEITEVSDDSGFWIIGNMNTTVPSSRWTHIVLVYDEVTGFLSYSISNSLGSSANSQHEMAGVALQSVGFALGSGGLVDDVSISTNQPLSASPGIDAMYGLVGLVALIGIGLPLIAVTGGSPTEKAIKIIVYLIVVGALIGVAFYSFTSFPPAPPT